MVKLDSAHVKKLLIHRFNFYNGYVGAVYEASNLNSADVIAVRHGGKVQEYEIKVSRSDLIGEMRCARVAKGLDGLDSYMKRTTQLALTDNIELNEAQRAVLLTHGHSLSKTKLEKHRMYLTDEGREVKPYYGFTPPKPFVPNTFYWCIPYALLDVCKQLNKGLPYGIYVFDMPQNDKYAAKYIMCPARSLGGQGDRLYFELFNRACTQWADARHDIVSLEAQVSGLKATLAESAADASMAQPPGCPQPAS